MSFSRIIVVVLLLLLVGKGNQLHLLPNVLAIDKQFVTLSQNKNNNPYFFDAQLYAEDDASVGEALDEFEEEDNDDDNNHLTYYVALVKYLSTSTIGNLVTFISLTLSQVRLFILYSSLKLDC